MACSINRQLSLLMTENMKIQKAEKTYRIEYRGPISRMHCQVGEINPVKRRGVWLKAQAQVCVRRARKGDPRVSGNVTSNAFALRFLKTTKDRSEEHTSELQSP